MKSKLSLTNERCFRALWIIFYLFKVSRSPPILSPDKSSSCMHILSYVHEATTTTAEFIARWCCHLVLSFFEGQSQKAFLNKAMREEFENQWKLTYLKNQVASRPELDKHKFLNKRGIFKIWSETPKSCQAVLKFQFTNRCSVAIKNCWSKKQECQVFELHVEFIEKVFGTFLFMEGTSKKYLFLNGVTHIYFWRFLSPS